jgi:hypothetical protein
MAHLLGGSWLIRQTSGQADEVIREADGWKFRHFILHISNSETFTLRYSSPLVHNRDVYMIEISKKFKLNSFNLKVGLVVLAFLC